MAHRIYFLNRDCEGCIPIRQCVCGLFRESLASISLGVNTSCPAIFKKRSQKQKKDSKNNKHTKYLGMLLKYRNKYTERRERGERGNTKQKQK